MSDSVRPHSQQPNRLPHPWDSSGKNTGVGCHFLLQCMKVKSESEVAQSCLTPSDPMDCSLPGFSVHGIFQARVLEWVAIAFSWVMLFLFYSEHWGLKMYNDMVGNFTHCGRRNTLGWWNFRVTQGSGCLFCLNRGLDLGKPEIGRASCRERV